MSAARAWETAMAAAEVALVETRLERLASESRIARLRHAAALEREGRLEEAAVILDTVRAEQAAGA